jgi:hypothetical protein
VAFLEQWQLAIFVSDEETPHAKTFRRRVQMAMVKVATLIVDEAHQVVPETHRRRWQLATSVLASGVGSTWVDAFSLAVATNPVISANSSDNDLEFTVNSVWNHLAGVQEDPPMPDLSLKARHLALDMISAADMVIGGLERLQACLQEKEGTGLDWTATEIQAMLAGDPQLQHVTGSHLNNLHSNAAAVYNAMVSGGTLGAFTDDVFQAVRPGNLRTR